MFQDLFNDKKFYSIFFKLAIPVTLQYFFSSSLNLIDNIMVGQLGATELAAVGLANQVYFVLLLFLLGIGGGASLFAAQFWGKKDIKNIRRILGLSIMIGVSSALVFFGVSFFYAQGILRFFSNDPQVVHLGSQFLSISSFSYVLLATTSCYAAVLRSTGEVKLPMRVNVIAIVCNTALNYLLIFGHFGLPRMGVAGSALATLISRSVETAILLWVSYRKEYVVAAKLRELFDIPRDLVKRFVNMTGVLVAKDTVWAVGVALYMAVYGKMGTDAVASVNIVTNVRQLLFVLFNGIASACLVMVGNQIGAGDDVKAFNYAKRFLKLAFLGGIILGALGVGGSRLVFAPYNVPQNVIHQAISVWITFCLYLPFYAFNNVAIVGVLRGGGDAKFCLYLDLVAVYLIGMPLALLGQAVWKLPVAGVFALLTLQEIFKFILTFRRIPSKRWINNLVYDFSCDPVALN